MKIKLKSSKSISIEYLPKIESTNINMTYTNKAQRENIITKLRK